MSEGGGRAIHSLVLTLVSALIRFYATVMVSSLGSKRIEEKSYSVTS